MGIDRWKQEHRNWRPSGARHVVRETEPDEPSPPALSVAPREKPPSAKPRAAKKQAASSSGSSSGSGNRSSDDVQPKRSKR
ncbi:hypothetical protein V1291_005342 [Nitrobacteraceae bacterium AZCC 1564]